MKENTSPAVHDPFLFLLHNSPIGLLYRAILKTIRDAVVFVSLEGRVLLINDFAKKILEKNIEQTLFWELFPDDYFGFSLKETLQLGLSHKLIYHELKNGKILEVTATFLFDGPKSLHGLLITFRDISEKEELKRALRRNEQMQQLGEMTASIAHEIRNPLGGIRGYASLLARDLKMQTHLQDMAQLILEGAKILERLVSSVVHYARPVQLQLKSVDICQFLRNFVRFVKIDPACPPKTSWQLHVLEEPLIAPIDEEALKSALFNLIFNAFHAMPQGGRLTISLLKMQDSYEIAISDTGVGISQEKLPKLFTPFFTTKTDGNGLGLPEVQKIIKAHGGKIEVRSHIGKGTTFTLQLPIYRGYL